MAISIGSNSMYSMTSAIAKDSVKADDLKGKLQTGAHTDEEIMEVCKSFEAYMLEQVMKQMKKTVMSDEEQGDYLAQFGDILYEEYAKSATEGEGIGIAKMLYEAMKRNG